MPSVEDDGKGELLEGEGVSGISHGEPVGLRKVHEAAHGGCEGVGVGDGNEETGAVGDEGFCSAGSVGGDDGKGVGSGFKRGEGQALPKGGKDAGMGGAELKLEVGDEAEEVNAGGDVELVSELLEGCEFRAGAGDGEVGVGGKLGKGAEEGWVVLEGDEAADGEPVECAIYCGLGGISGRDGNGVGEEGAGSGRSEAGAEQGDVRGVADCGEMGGEWAGGAEEELLDSGAEGRGVNSGEDDAGGGDEADETGEEDGVGEVGVKDVRPVLAVPAEKGEPAARVEPGLAHMEAEDGDAGCGEGGAMIFCGARESDECDMVAALRECGREGEDLALGTGDLVEGRDEDCDVGHGRSPVARCRRHCCQAGMEFSRPKGARKVCWKRAGREPGRWRVCRAEARAAERDGVGVTGFCWANHTPGAWARSELSAGKVSGRTSGRPAAAASSMALGMPSRVEERTKRVASRQYSTGLRIWPGRETDWERPSSLIRARRSDSSGPMPRRDNWRCGQRSRRGATASRSVRKPFSGERRPMARSLGPGPGGQGHGEPAGAGARSIGFGRT